MDAIRLLTDDHRRVQELFKRIDEAKGDREQLFQEVARELRVHAGIEEAFLYPAVKDVLRDRVAESLEEHHQYEMVLDDLAKIGPSDLDWQGRFNALKEDVNHHIKDEEAELFPKTRQLLNERQLEELGQRMEEQKASLAEKTGAHRR
jgi:hemerythrin superfamily protein